MNGGVWLSPGDYRTWIVESCQTNDPAAAGRAIEQADARRFPPLARFHPSAYPLPEQAALLLYQSSRTGQAATLGRALGSPADIQFRKRAAEFVGAAYARHDWATIGWLAYMFDYALAVTSVTRVVRESQNDRPAPVEQVQLCHPGTIADTQRWLQSLDDLATRYPAAYTRCALAYCQVLPASLPVPPTLEGDEPGNLPAEDELWPLLRLLWSHHYDAWQAEPDMIGMLGQCRNPFVANLADRIRRGASALPPPAEGRPRVAGLFVDVQEPPVPSLARFRGRLRSGVRSWLSWPRGRRKSPIKRRP